MVSASLSVAHQNAVVLHQRIEAIQGVSVGFAYKVVSVYVKMVTVFVIRRILGLRASVETQSVVSTLCRIKQRV